MCEERSYDKLYREGEFFFIPMFLGEAVASERLPKKLEAKTQGEALAEAKKKYGHGGIVVMKVTKD